MLRNYFTTAVRGLLRRRGYALINLFGLGVGLAAATLIGLFARSELTYDRFHAKADRIHYVLPERVTPTGVQPTWGSWVPLMERLRQDFPAVRGGVRVSTEQRWVQFAGRRFEEEVTYADPALFELFTLPLARGDARRPLPGRRSAVVSAETAARLFGGEDPIGQVIVVDHAVAYTVTGVLDEVPANSSIRPRLVLPVESAPWYADGRDDWGNAFLDTFVELREPDAAGALAARFPAFIASVWDAETAGRTHLRLVPLPELYEARTGNRKYAYILLAIALGTILIACINFTNLATARSLERTREIGVRKALGASRRQLAAQFLSESLLVSLAALVLSAGLTELALPLFNRLYGLELRFDLFERPAGALALAGVGLAVGLLSGGYPALFLSRFRPVESLKGRPERRSGGAGLRNALVVVQFGLAAVLIAGTLVVWGQLRFMERSDLAFAKEQVVVLPVEAADFADADAAAVRLETFRQELARLPGVAAVATSSHVPGDWAGWFTFALPEGGDPERPMRLPLAYLDARYFDAYGIRLLEGRGFREGSGVDRDGAVVINRAAREAFGWERAVGKSLRRGEATYTVVGVVEDYHVESLQFAVPPLLHFYRPPENPVHNFVSLRLRPGGEAAALAGARRAWQALDPARALEYRFADEQFARLYAAQRRLVAVGGAFAALAILIACLGLFGLTSLVVAQRTREIGVRKVLGASVPGIVLLLSRQFLGLVLLAVVLAAPVAYFAMRRWLEEFAYRVTLGPGLFLLAGFLALLLALLTVSYQSARAARADPVKSLRYE